MTHSRVRLRAHALVAATIGLALTLAACGSDEPETASGGATIDTAYGEITVPEKPERIVALSGRHLELLTLLDETPVAFTDYGADDAALIASYPWMKGTYEGKATPELFTADYQPSPEEIAELDPDLILTTIWQTDEQLYKQLSKIAPTYAGIETDTNTTWQDDLAALAKLTGNDPAIVDEVEADYEKDLAKTAEQVPGLEGATFQVAALGDGEQFFLTEYAAAPLLGLGLEAGEGQPVDGEGGAAATGFSQENIDRLTADVVLIAAENRDPSGKIRAAVEADPRLADLPASKNGTLIFLESGQWNALNGGTATSVLWALDQILPTLSESPLNQGGQ
ncbi:ABC transporter substrate-binding protein [Aeromicrobium choanae]|uniref:Iron complex transport system substrate-binding protein n=1 Tax=Aeromicrobium choanae TaxID=1736691 RepID=A0A1T4YRE4_9ACTN|nr:ABC transporter substrate-binding protein [Aeromicrobium choanae]SKB04243.1 iron complex transport system substrate-binding protein [Aeromicrobium choanae]